MKRVFMKNKVFVLALVLALLGAVLLGTVFACAIQKEAAAATEIEREQAVEIVEDSKMPTPTPVQKPQPGDKMAIPALQGGVENAEQALAIAKHAAETLSGFAFTDDATTEYNAEKSDEHYTMPAHWIVRDSEENMTMHVQIDAETGRLNYFSCGARIQNTLDGWGSATVEDGEAVVKDHAAVLAEAEARIRAFSPAETVQESWVSSVIRQEGYLYAYVMVTTDVTTYNLDFIRNDGWELTECALFSGIVERDAELEAQFYDNDADAWMWELENFDDIKLVNPRKFEKADPKDAMIPQEEIERRCKEFFAMATDGDAPGVLVKFYRDLSLEREDYYAVTMFAGSDKIKLALSAETGDLLAWEGEIPVYPILMYGARELWDWCWDDDCAEFDYALAGLEKLVRVLCGSENLKAITVNAVHDDYYMTLDAEMTTGRTHEFGFEIKNGKAKLRYVEVYYSEDAFRNTYMVPWEADARVIDPNTGEIHLGWFGQEKLGAALLP